MPQKKKPGKTVEAEPTRTARRERMAVARVDGQTITAIAEAEGLSRVWASRELAERETQAIVARLVDARSERVSQLFERSLAAIEDALGANKEYVVAGNIEDGGPDHFARLAAAAKLTDLLKAGRSAPKPTPAKADEKRLLTIEEIERALTAARSNHGS